MPSQQLVNIIIKATDEASATAEKVDSKLRNMGKGLKSITQTPAFDNLRTKLSNVATTIDNKFGGALTKARNRFSSFKDSVVSVGSSMRTKFGGALDGVRSKLSSVTNATKNTASGMSFLKGAASMTAAMVGFELVSSLVETTRASLNARSSIQAFGQRLNMSGQEVTTFQTNLDKLQDTYKKIDMDVVGQQAMDMAYRLGLPKTALTELTETSAIFTDAMVRNGRSSEDATLALADAMDGEFRRLKEIGISQDDLMKNGWSGDLNDKTGLLNAMNKALKEQHYDELAKSVDTLDDAWQVLSITLSNLLESILVPLTPAIVGVISGVTDAINSIKSAWSSLPDFAQLGIGIGVVVGAIILIAAVLWSTYIPAWIAAASATWAAIAPVLPIVIAVAAAVAILVAVIYEVGKAFGWWSDVGSMFDAIKAGIMRMWEAFINHPDVQAAIAAVGNALQTLWGWIQQAGQAIMEFFGISTGGEWDVVGSIIQAVGLIWEDLSNRIKLAITIIKAVAGAISYLYNGAVSLGSFIMDVLSPAISWLSALWGVITEAIQPVVDVFQQFQDGQVGLVDVITTVASSLWTVWTTITSALGGLILQLLSNLLTWAIQGGLNFLTGIQTYLSQVPGRVGTFLMNTLTKIIAIGSQWVAIARVKANLLLLGVVSYLRQLPGKALSALIQVVSSIVSAGAQWVSNARTKAEAVVRAVVDKLTGLPGQISSALSGVVSAITGPFQSAYSTLCGIVDNIKSKAAEVGNLLPAGGDLPMGGDGPMGGDIGTASGGETVIHHESDPIEINENINLNLNLENVPSHIDTGALISMLNNKEVIRAFVENRDFQSIDAQVKQRLNWKVNRSRGV